MARRATSLIKGRKAAKTAAPADVSEPVTAKALPRGKTAKLRDVQPTDMSMTDAFFPGGDEPAPSVADPGLNSPTKARRRRQPTSQPAPEPSASLDDRTKASSAKTEDTRSTKASKGSGVATDNTAAPSASPRRTRRGPQSPIDAQSPVTTANKEGASAAHSPAARWHADTNTATFDWSNIEHVAATDGPNQAIAKLLLAARAEGANSRWPF